MVNFELGDEIEKDFFVLSPVWDREKLLVFFNITCIFNLKGTLTVFVYIQFFCEGDTPGKTCRCTVCQCRVPQDTCLVPLCVYVGCG